MKKGWKRFLLLLSLGMVVVVGGLYLLGLTFHQEIHDDIMIHASDERVWQILTDYSHYPDWNPYIRRASGELKSGAQLNVRLQPSGTAPTDLQTTIVTLESKRKFCWLGHILIPGLLDGQHCFTITPLGANTVRLTQSEAFSGLLIPFLTDSLERETPRGFTDMNQALKRRAEQTSHNILYAVGQ